MLLRCPGKPLRFHAETRREERDRGEELFIVILSAAKDLAVVLAVVPARAGTAATAATTNDQIPRCARDDKEKRSG
jgi:hypothetical protein